MKQMHRQQGSRRTADGGQTQQGGNADSPFSMYRVSFVDAIDCYCNDMIWVSKGLFE